MNTEELFPMHTTVEGVSRALQKKHPLLHTLVDRFQTNKRGDLLVVISRDAVAGQVETIESACTMLWDLDSEVFSEQTPDRTWEP